MLSKTVVLFCTCVVLAQHSAASAFLGKPLEAQTKKALQTLKSLPSHCSQHAAELILAEKEDASKQLGSCSKAAIAFYGEQLMTDSSYFSFDLWNHGSAIAEKARECYTKKCFMQKVFCVVEKVPSMLMDIVDIGTGALSFAVEMKTLIPKVKEEIEACKGNKTLEYKRFLESQVLKAKSC